MRSEKLRNGKAAEKSGIVAEMLKASGDFKVVMVTSLITANVREERLLIYWEDS